MKWFALIFFLSYPAWSSEVWVGSAESIMTVPPEAALGGYGQGDRLKSRASFHLKRPWVRRFKAYESVIDPIQIKAMVIQNKKEKLLWLSYDLVGVTAQAKKRLMPMLASLGFDEDRVLMSATHTHSGPGNLSRNLFWSVFALDFYNPRVWASLETATKKAVEVAIQNQIPSQLFKLRVPTIDLQRSRRGHDAAVDRNARILFAKDQAGQIHSVVVNYAVHGVALDDQSLGLSGDLPSAIAKTFSKEIQKTQTRQTPPVVLFVNGAVGDVSPTETGMEALQSYPQKWVNQVTPHLAEATPFDFDLKIHRRQIRFSAPRLHLKHCGLSKRDTDFAIKIWGLLPRKTTLTYLEMGSLKAVTWPGEPTSLTQQSFRQELSLSKEEQDGLWILGLTNDHAGYFVSSEEYQQGGYEACLTFFGQGSSDFITSAYRRIKTTKSIP